MRLPYNRGGLRTYVIVLGLIAGHATPRSIGCGTLLLLAGIALHLWAKGCLHQEKEVTTGGPYRFVRHPFYVGNAFLDAGLAVMSGWWVLAITLPVWWLAIYVPEIRREEARMVDAFGDLYRAYRRRVPLLVPLRRPLPATTGGFSWQNGNLRRTEIPRAFRFLSYPAMFFFSYRLHAVGTAIVASPTLLDVMTMAAGVALLGVGGALRQHFKHARAILPPWMIGDASRFAMLLAVIVVGTCVTHFEVEADLLVWVGGAAALGLSVALRSWNREQPVLAEAVLALGLAVLFELHWLALLLVPLHVAIVLDSRLSRASSAGRPPLRTGPAFRAAYELAFAGGVALSLAKELLA